MISKQVWETLSAINVNEHTEKKGSLTYLSWAWAWGTLMEHFPDAMYEFDEPKFYEDGSCEVKCTVIITVEEQSMYRHMTLPVMDNRNNAVKNPDARGISDTRMRCLVKCLAMFGLGHYIYAGEDLPANSPNYTPEQKKAFDDFLNGSSLGLYMFRRRVGDEVYSSLYNSFEAGAKVSGKKLADDQEKIGIDVFNAILKGIEDDDSAAVYELIEDETPTVIALLKSQLSGPQRKSLEFILGNQA